MSKNYFFLFCTLMAFSIAANAQEWERQNPLPQLVQLEAIAVDPSGVGLTGGEEGVLLRTTDFGAEWNLVAADFQSTVLEVAFVPGADGQAAWISLSGNDKLARSDDGGQTWEMVDPGIGIGNIVYLSLPEAGSFFAGSTQGVIKSTDQGASWEEITPPFDQPWSAVFFIDAATGWVAADEGNIYRTTDGGASWTEISPGQFDRKVRLQFLDANHGYAAVFKSFYETEDGGDSWTLLSDIAFATDMEALAVVNDTFMLATRGNSTYATVDGGLTWEREIPLSYSYVNQAICGLPDGRAWVAGSHTMIGYSEDGGLTFTDQLPGNKNTLRYIRFVDMDHGWACGQGGTVLRTVDGGASWTDLSLEDDDRVWDGLAVSADEFWACQGNDILRTTDGGQSWDILLPATGGNFTGIVRVENRVYATNYNGKVYRTLDDGASWEALPTEHEEQLFGLSFPSPDTGYAVGRDSTVLKTTDGGDSWERLDIPTSLNLESVFFRDENRGWVMPSFNADFIFYTEDGGASWSVVELPVPAFWKGFYFTDAENGYLIGGTALTGRVLRTEDSGASWEESYTSYGLFNGISGQMDEMRTRFWICGFGGNIERWEEMTVDARETPNVQRVEFFPNPARQMVQVQLPTDLKAGASLRVYDLQGRLRLQRPAAPLLELNSLAPGAYLLELENGDKTFRSRLLKLGNN